jgi:hypothetical protein
MDKVFEPDELELADVQGDPNRVIEVQRDVKDLLQSTRHRAPVMWDKIAACGASALPGVINATFVWMSELEGGQKREMMAKLIAELARDNPAASGLVFRAGVLESPFDGPRAICSQALQLLNWQPDPPQAEELRRELASASRLDDTARMLDLCGLLFRAGNKRDFDEAQRLCISWVQPHPAEAGQLLRLILDQYPDRTVPLMSAVFGATAPKFKDENLARALLAHIDSLACELLADGRMLEISRIALAKARFGRLTVIEYLWVNAVRDCSRRQRAEWDRVLPKISAELQNEDNQNMLRYWFRAVGEAGEIEYIIEQTNAEADLFGIAATAQLFYKRGKEDRARQRLIEIQSENPFRYREAEEQYEGLTSGVGKTKDPIQQARRAGELTQAQ